MRGRATITVVLALLVSIFMCAVYAERAPAVPDGFGDEPVVDVPAPTALAFTPDNQKMLVASRTGELYVVENGQKILALDLPKVCANGERGLLGVAVPPDFGTADNHVYLYYTYKKHNRCPVKDPRNKRNPVNRVSRFEMTGNTVDLGSEEVLIDNIPSPNGNHNAGDLHFDAGGLLYVSVGDGGCNYMKPGRCQYENAASRRGNVLLGKILRITRNGGIPAGNPYTDPGTSARCDETGRTGRGKNCQETYARGFRNPFRFAMNPNATGSRLFINDVGGKKWEEIDEGAAGADYGWNLCEGRHDNRDRRGQVDCDGTNYTGPIHEYSHTTGCESITGGAFVPNGGSWPDEYDNSYLFGDFICGKIFSLTPDGNGGYNKELFTRVPGPGPISMAFDPSGQALYYTTFAGGGQVHRIAPIAG